MTNQIKTLILLTLLSALLIVIGGYFGGKTGLTIALILAIIFNFFSYWFSDKIVLKMYGAKEVDKNSKLYELVKEVAIRANLPIPIAYNIGILSLISPAGIGIREGVMTFMLLKFFDLEFSNKISVLFRIFNLIIELFLSLIAYILYKLDSHSKANGKIIKKMEKTKNNK